MIEETMKIVKCLGRNTERQSKILKACRVSDDVFHDAMFDRTLASFIKREPVFEADNGNDTWGNQRPSDYDISVTVAGHIAYEQYRNKQKSDWELRRDRWITRGLAFIAVVVSIIALYVAWITYTAQQESQPSQSETQGAT